MVLHKLLLCIGKHPASRTVFSRPLYSIYTEKLRGTMHLQGHLSGCVITAVTSQVENDLDRILRQSRGFGVVVSIRSVRFGVSCFGLYWWMLGLEPMALALKKRCHFLMWEAMLHTWIFQGVRFMDDIWGAEKPHPLGFKQHPNWKMLVCLT